MYKNISYLNASNETIKMVEAFLKEWYNEETFVTVRTSGSTGIPSTIILEKEKMIVSAKKTLEFLNISTGSTALLCLSPETIAGKMMIVRSIVGTLKLYVGPLSSTPLKNCDVQIDFAAMVPLQLQSELENQPDKLKSIRNCIIGGGPISQKLELDLAKNKISVQHTFGMTETISHVAMRKAGYQGEKIFRAIPGIHFSVLDDKLIIHYPEIRLDQLQTNDVVHLISDTSFEWIGRSDFMINSGGVKMTPEEIETKLSAHIPFPFFIAGLPDEKLGQKIILIIEHEKSSKLSKSELQKHLTKYQVPKQVYYLDSFIRTISGKVNRIETLKLLEQHVASEIL